MPDSLVEHLEHGVAVQCADGTRIVCKPLPLRDMIFFVELWDQLAEAQTPKARIKLRFDMATRFNAVYPELAEHISGADVEALLPNFFWIATGATVVPPAPGRNGGNGSPSTGTMRRRSTARSGA